MEELTSSYLDYSDAMEPEELLDLLKETIFPQMLSSRYRSQIAVIVKRITDHANKIEFLQRLRDELTGLVFASQSPEVHKSGPAFSALTDDKDPQEILNNGLDVVTGLIESKDSSEKTAGLLMTHLTLIVHEYRDNIDTLAGMQHIINSNESSNEDSSRAWLASLRSFYEFILSLPSFILHWFLVLKGRFFGLIDRNTQDHEEIRVKKKKPRAQTPLTEPEKQNRQILKDAAREWPARLAKFDSAVDIARILQMVTGSGDRLLSNIHDVIVDVCEERDVDGEHYGAALGPDEAAEDIDIHQKLQALFDHALGAFDRRNNAGRFFLFAIFQILMERWENDEKVDALMINLNIELSHRWTELQRKIERRDRGHGVVQLGSEAFRSGPPTIGVDSDED